MQTLSTALLLSATLFAATAAAQTAKPDLAPKKAPEGATGVCKDGTYSMTKSRRGACSGHKGVQTWYTESRSTRNQQLSDGTNQPKSTPSTTPAAASPEPIASPAPHQ